MKTDRIAVDVEERAEEDGRDEVEPLEALVGGAPDRRQGCETQPGQRNKCGNPRPVVLQR